MTPVTIAVFVLGAVLIALVALFVAAPLFRPPEVAPPEAEPGERERWERQKRQALAAIKETELDHRWASSPTRIWRRMRARFEAQALEAMAALEREGASMITIDQFQRAGAASVATVKAAEPHPNADRLLVLRVDLGGEERQIVAGIRAHYEPETLVGRQVVVVANLEPAKLRGVESQGMLLAASSGDRVVLVRPDEPVTAGRASVR